MIIDSLWWKHLHLCIFGLLLKNENGEMIKNIL